MNDLLVMVGLAALGSAAAFLIFAYNPESDATYKVTLGAISMVLWFTNANLTITMYPAYYVLGLLYYFVSVLFLLYTVYEAFLWLDRSRRGASWWNLGRG